jgi:hypothetical protein
MKAATVDHMPSREPACVYKDASRARKVACTVAGITPAGSSEG